MQNMLSSLVQSGAEVNKEQLAKELLRHQTPLAFQVSALIEQLKYQKSLIPQHVVEPLIDSIKEYVNKELDALK